MKITGYTDPTTYYTHAKRRGTKANGTPHFATLGPMTFAEASHRDLEIGWEIMLASEAGIMPTPIFSL